MDTDLLTSALRKNGYLDNASVQSVELNALETIGIGSKFYTATLTYTTKQHRLPDRMVVKRPLLTDRGQGEANVYERVLRGVTGIPIMECFAVVDEHPQQPLSFLFKDLSESHSQTDWPIIPSLEKCSQAISTIARVHSHWWGNTSSIDAGTPPIAQHQNSSHLATFFAEFVDLLRDYLTPAWITEYERVLTNVDGLLDIHLHSENSTLLHSDPHFWNFLYPNDVQQNDCILFDWPLWRTGLAGSDLAYMIALHLYPEHRRRFETVLLEQYHRLLNEQGVTYTLNKVNLDYRIGVIVGLLMPLMEFSWNNPPMSWIPKLEKSLVAYDDLDCRELLESV